MSSTASLDDYRWLVSAEAAELLARLPATSTGLVTLASQLRAALGPGRTHLALEQVELRRRAVDKFSHAAEMFFTPIGLEQATDDVVARYKAQRFSQGIEVADLCCGIGGDLLALAQRGPVVGVDANAAVALLAAANCRQLIAASSARVRVDRAETFPLPDVAAWHIDPDRRATGRRTTRVEAYQPGLETLERLRRQVPAGAIKLAPAAEAPSLWRDESELEWISRRGQCRQLVAWFGPLARWSGQHVATILQSDPGGMRTVCGRPEIDVPLEPELGHYLFEPDAAVLAARLSGALAEEHSLHQFEPDICYLTGNRPLDDPALAAFEVIDVLPLDIKQLRRYLRQRQIGRLEVKKRGVKLEPETIRRQLIGSCQGSEELTLLLTRQAGRSIAIAARRPATT